MFFLQIIVSLSGDPLYSVMSAIISRSFRGCQLTSKRVGFFTTDQLLTKQRPSVQLILQPRITVMSPSDIFSKKILRQLSTDCFVNDNIHVGEEHKNTSPDSSKRNRVTRTVKRIQEKLHEQSVKFGDEHVTVFTELLFESGFPENHVENLLLSQLKVLRSTTGVLQSAISLLKNRGFLIHQIAPVLASHPNLFSGDIGSLQNTIDTLSGLGFKDGRVQDMISRAPELMTVTTNQFTHHIFRFQELFSRTETIKLLSRCPGLLLERWSSLSAKAEYAKEEMGLSDLASLLHCDLLTHPLIHIQTRHTFLTRAGLYPKVRSKNCFNIIFR